MRIIHFFGSLLFNLLIACFAIMFVYILGTIVFGMVIIMTCFVLDLLKELF